MSNLKSLVFAIDDIKIQNSKMKDSYAIINWVLTFKTLYCPYFMSAKYPAKGERIAIIASTVTNRPAEMLFVTVITKAGSKIK